MFGSKGRKFVEQHASSVLTGFQKTVLDDTGQRRDIDAVLLFTAWLHATILMFLAEQKIKAQEIHVALNAGAIAIRAKAPDHGLEIDFIEVARVRVLTAIHERGGGVDWPFTYYSAVKDQVAVSEEAFAGALLGELANVGKAV